MANLYFQRKKIFTYGVMLFLLTMPISHSSGKTTRQKRAQSQSSSSTSKRRATTLHLAAAKERSASTIDRLMKDGANLNEAAYSELVGGLATPLMVATAAEIVSNFWQIIDYNADLNISLNGQTALSIARRKKNDWMIKALVCRGAAMTREDFSYALREAKNFGTIFELISRLPSSLSIQTLLNEENLSEVALDTSRIPMIEFITHFAMVSQGNLQPPQVYASFNSIPTYQPYFGRMDDTGVEEIEKHDFKIYHFLNESKKVLELKKPDGTSIASGLIRAQILLNRIMALKYLGGHNREPESFREISSILDPSKYPEPIEADQTRLLYLRTMSAILEEKDIALGSKAVNDLKSLIQLKIAQPQHLPEIELSFLYLTLGNLKLLLHQNSRNSISSELVQEAFNSYKAAAQTLTLNPVHQFFVDRQIHSMINFGFHAFNRKSSIPIPSSLIDLSALIYRELAKAESELALKKLDGSLLRSPIEQARAISILLMTSNLIDPLSSDEYLSRVKTLISLTSSEEMSATGRLSDTKELALLQAEGIIRSPESTKKDLNRALVLLKGNLEQSSNTDPKIFVRSQFWLGMLFKDRLRSRFQEAPLLFNNVIHYNVLGPLYVHLANKALYEIQNSMLVQSHCALKEHEKECLDLHVELLDAVKKKYASTLHFESGISLSESASSSPSPMSSASSQISDFPQVKSETPIRESTQLKYFRSMELEDLRYSLNKAARAVRGFNDAPKNCVKLSLAMLDYYIDGRLQIASTTPATIDEFASFLDRSDEISQSLENHSGVKLEGVQSQMASWRMKVNLGLFSDRVPHHEETFISSNPNKPIDLAQTLIDLTVGHQPAYQASFPDLSKKLLTLAQQNRHKISYGLINLKRENMLGHVLTYFAISDHRGDHVFFVEPQMITTFGQKHALFTDLREIIQTTDENSFLPIAFFIPTGPV